MACVFCQIASQQIYADVLFKDEELIAFHDLHPQAPVHFLVVPRKHIVSLDRMDPDDHALLGRMVGRAVELARREGIGDGFRLAVNCGERGGQTVWHVHMHVLGGRQLSGRLG